MDVQIRTANPDTDYDRVAAILRQNGEDAATANHIRNWDRNQPAGMIRRRAVAVDGRDEIVGYSAVVYHPRHPAQRFFVGCMVDTPYMQQGIGTRLYEDAVAFARSHGATEFMTQVAEVSPAGMAFAQKQGFVVEHHVFTSEVDLTTFDEAAFAGTLERVVSAGIRFSSLAAEGNTPEQRQALWDLNRRTANDNPGNGPDDDSFPTFDTFEQQILNADWFRADGQILALDGDTFVGLGAVLMDPYVPDSSYNAFTGVDRAYRGKGIAQALKLLTLRFAKQHGAKFMRTDNNSLNAPMLAINRKFGYQPVPGLYWLIKK